MSEALNETEVIKAPEGTKKKLDPGFSRNLKIIAGALGAVVLLVVLAAMVQSGPGKDDVRQSDLQVGGSNVQPAGQITPAMENMLREQQQIEAAAAAEKGKSYIPPDTTGRTETVNVLPVQMSPSSYEAAAIQNNAQPSAQDQRRREGLERQLAAYLNESERADSARVRVVAEKVDGGSTATTNSVVAAPTGSSQQIVPGLEIVAGTLAGDLNVPAGTSVFASALVRSGVLNGAFMVGSARVVDEALEINFTQMRFGTKTYAIDAIVLDQDTTANAIAGNVDRRILQRYVFPIALATAQGFFSAKAAVGSIAVNVGEAAAVATPAASGEQARAAGVAEGIKLAGQEVQRTAAKPIVVSAVRGTSVGLLFRSPVTEEIK